ncbi:phosphatidate cytidylyltransferase [Pilobolus umbonatus]|nr:phosphatidate cytidylyltransferase [Pilobolus umbonatus]
MHLVVLYITVQPIFISLNLQNGLFWFLFPCFLVILNDTSAFICGRWMGKRKLIQLSPNKTMEGFIGGIVLTVLFSQNTPQYIIDEMGHHALILALYASLIAPFSGFLTSALKRAAGIKDFGTLIPGHGGLTDRLDCQLFMSVFTYVYFDYIQKR